MTQGKTQGKERACSTGGRLENALWPVILLLHAPRFTADRRG